MKIHQGSDLHLEFGRDTLEVPGGAEVLILAGDILVARDIRMYLKGTGTTKLRYKRMYRRFEKFFQECSQKYPYVLYIMGNHEHYDNKFHDTADTLRSWFEELKLDNVYLLDNQSYLINNVKFFGATLWTDMRRSDPMVMWDVQRGMNDCTLIQYREELPILYGSSKGGMIPQEMVKEHEFTLQTLKRELSTGHKTVVITHHAPSYQSIPEHYRLDNLSFAYSSNLEDLIEMSENLEYWFHGHTHTPFDYKIGNTSIICNPRGYFGQGSNKEIRKYSFKEIEINES